VSARPRPRDDRRRDDDHHPDERPLATVLPAWLPTRDPTGRPAAGRTLRLQGEDTVRRLLAAGRTAFARQGYAATRVDDVVAAAGTSHGTFYLYFRNKEDLLHRLAIECGVELARFTARLDELDEPAPIEALEAWVDGFVAAYRDHAPVLRVWLERRDLDPLMQSLANETLGGLSAALARRLDPRLDERVEPGITTLALLSLLERMSGYLEASDGAMSRRRTVVTVAAMVHATFRQGR
jgi:AcrR family transcriptional regulator